MENQDETRNLRLDYSSPDWGDGKHSIVSWYTLSFIATVSDNAQKRTPHHLMMDTGAVFKLFERDVDGSRAVFLEQPWYL